MSASLEWGEKTTGSMAYTLNMVIRKAKNFFGYGGKCKAEGKRTHKLCNHRPLWVIIKTKISDCTSDFCLPHNWKICFCFVCLFVFLFKTWNYFNGGWKCDFGLHKITSHVSALSHALFFAKGSECLSGSDGEKSSLSYAHTEEVTVTFAGPLGLMSQTVRTGDPHPWPWSEARRLPVPWQSDHPLNPWWTPSWTRAPRPCSFFRGCGESAPRSRDRWLCWLQWYVQKKPSENLMAARYWQVLIHDDKHLLFITFIVYSRWGGGTRGH